MAKARKILTKEPNIRTEEPNINMISKKEKQKALIALYTDPIFFHISQIKIGTQFRYMGRTGPGTIWKVTKIVSFSKKNGMVKSTLVPQCQHLSDDIHLQCSDRSFSDRVMAFCYMSYSAIWRIKD